MTERTTSYCHMGGDVPLLGDTIGDCTDAVAARHPDALAVISRHQDRRMTYAEFHAAAGRVARGLIGLGIQRGDRVGIWATSNIEWMLLQMATAKMGAILVNINPAYRLVELEHALNLAEVQTAVCIPAFRTSDYVQMLRTLVPEADDAAPGAWRAATLPHLEHLLVYDPMDVAGTTAPAPGWQTWGDLLAAGDDVPEEILRERQASLDPDDEINIQFTSGTTGAPKAATLTHFNILNNAACTAQIMNFGPDDTLCVPVPFYHCFGMVLSNLLCQLSGATVAIPDEYFDPETTLRTVAEERCTALHGVPTMFVAELEHPVFPELDLTSLRTGIMAGAMCPEELMKRVIGDMHCSEILIGYGQTEASPLTHITRPNDSLARRTATVGTSLPHQECKIVDANTDHTVPIGVQGEVCFRGPHVMSRYYNHTDATAAAIDRAGWLHSGDLGTMDADGYVRITGRLKDMVVRGGENIYPAEVEAFYFTHPKVAQIAIVGVPDDRLGEELVAFVQLREGETCTPDELRAFAEDQIAHYKIPRRWRFVTDYPMTVTGKIQKFKLREQALESE